jgi:hypothetical protein
LEIAVRPDPIHVIVKGLPEATAKGIVIAFDGVDEGDFITCKP